MSVLTEAQIDEIETIRKDMAVRGRDTQRKIIVNDCDCGLVTCFGGGRSYHVYFGGECVAMLNSARALYDFLNSKFEGWSLKKQMY